MKIELNGEPLDTPASNLAELCRLEGFGEVKIATALNGTFVPEPTRDTYRLNEGDKIEIVAPRQGG